VIGCYHPCALDKRHTVGLWTAALGYVVLAVNAVLNYGRGSSHSEHMHESGQYLGLWPTTLAVSLAVSTLVVSLAVSTLVLLLSASVTPQRRALTSLAAILIIGIPRIATDPRCLANITTQHGCHTFMAAMLLVVVGSVLLLIPARE
jgi:hypothetical protein